GRRRARPDPGQPPLAAFSHGGVGPGLELEGGGDAVEQVEQLPDLRFAQSVCNLPVELRRLPLRLPEELPAGGRQVEVADPAVVGVRLALEQAALLELVD